MCEFFIPLLAKRSAALLVLDTLVGGGEWPVASRVCLYNKKCPTPVTL